MDATHTSTSHQSKGMTRQGQTDWGLPGHQTPLELPSGEDVASAGGRSSSTHQNLLLRPHQTCSPANSARVVLVSLLEAARTFCSTSAAGQVPDIPG